MANRHLGDLGTVRASADDVVTFGYFGQTIRANPHASDLAFIEFLDAAEDIDAADELKAVKLVMQYLRDQIHPDDWQLFWTTAKANGQSSVDLMALSHQIGEAVSGFPTGLPPASRAGRRAAARKSGAASQSRATRTRGRHSPVVDGEAVETETPSVVAEAMDILDGRPDLKAAVWQAHQARVATRG